MPTCHRVLLRRAAQRTHPWAWPWRLFFVCHEPEASPSVDSEGVTTVPPFLLACLAYLTVALPGSTLGLVWPSMRLSFHEPLGALGVLLAFGVTASVVSSAATGRILSRVGVGPLLTSLFHAGPRTRPLGRARRGWSSGRPCSTSPSRSAGRVRSRICQQLPDGTGTSRRHEVGRLRQTPHAADRSRGREAFAQNHERSSRSRTTRPEPVIRAAMCKIL